MYNLKFSNSLTKIIPKHGNLLTFDPQKSAHWQYRVLLFEGNKKIN
jgi:hypothetical protein